MKLYLFDLDGTIALNGHREHFVTNPFDGDPTWKPDWPAFFKACVDDVPNVPIINLMLDLCDAGVRSASAEVWIVSGRSDEVETETRDWLLKFGVPYDNLMMREEGDFTPDDELKKSWFEGGVEDIAMVFDDRDKVVKMWRDLGVVCAQVAPGDF